MLLFCGAPTFAILMQMRCYISISMKTCQFGGYILGIFSRKQKFGKSIPCPIKNIRLKNAYNPLTDTPTMQKKLSNTDKFFIFFYLQLSIYTCDTIYIYFLIFKKQELVIYCFLKYRFFFFKFTLLPAFQPVAFLS